MELDQLIETYQAGHPADDPVIKLLTDIRTLDAKRDASLFALLDKTDQLDRKLAALPANAPLDAWLSAYRQELDTLADARRTTFGIALEAELKPLGLKLQGRYPLLTAGLFTFELNLVKGRCLLWYGPKQEKLAEKALDAAKVAAEVKRQRGQLGSGLELAVVTNLIRVAYRHARLDRPQGSLPVPALLPYLAILVQRDSFRADPVKARYRGYGRADLSYDLYRLRDTRPQFRLTTATRQQTERRIGFLWVPAREDVDGADYVANIEFKEDQP